MSDDSRSSAAAFDPQSVLDSPALLARHDRWLRTAVLARLREPDGVDEVMQRVAVAAIQQRAPLLDLSKAAPWLYRLAIWQTLMYRRKAGRERKLAGHYREKLPENLRGCVESLIPAARSGAAQQSHLRWKFNKLSPHDAHLYWKAYNPIAEPQPPASTPPANPSESALEKLDKQIESLESQLGDLRKAMQELRQAAKAPK